MANQRLTSLGTFYKNFSSNLNLGFNSHFKFSLKDKKPQQVDLLLPCFLRYLKSGKIKANFVKASFISLWCKKIKVPDIPTSGTSSLWLCPYFKGPRV